MNFDTNAIQSQKIAVGLVEPAACWRLHDAAQDVRPDEAIVELGAFKGRTTGWLAWGAALGNGAHVWSVDPWENGDELPDSYVATARTIPEYRMSETRLAYEAHLERTGVRPYVTTIQARGVDAAKAWDGPKVGLLWHDALHRRKDVRDDIKAWLPHMADDAVIFFHDIGERRFGVEAGAGDVLAKDPDWDWDDREIVPWAKQPSKRGFMVVRRRGA